MSDGADAVVPAAARAQTPWRARAFAASSCVLGALSLLLLYFVPLPSSTFPWYRAGLSLAGTTMAIVALRTRPRGRVAVALAIAGLVSSLAFPGVVVFVFTLYLNLKG